MEPETAKATLEVLGLERPNKEHPKPMSKHGLGSLADLARILEEASNPESELREDRKETKPKTAVVHRKASIKQTRIIDPKRRAWYEKRLQEQAQSALPAALAAPAPVTPPAPAKTKAAAVRLGANLLETLAAAKDAKPKTEQKAKTEAWRRKPGDPVF